MTGQTLEADLERLEKARILVDGGSAFVIRGRSVPFEAILHVETAMAVASGESDGAAWRELRALARVVTDDRLDDPLLIELGARVSASDGELPEVDAVRMALRVRRVAEAAARVCGKPVVDKKSTS